MTTLLYIALWLLSGFLAAWIGHTFCDEGKLNTSRRAVFWLTVAGPFGLALALYDLIFYSDYLKKPFFKAKEPK